MWQLTVMPPTTAAGRRNNLASLKAGARYREATGRPTVSASLSCGSRSAYFAGEAAVMMGTESRGASNAKAKRELGWTLRYPSWRQGFVAAYASTSQAERRKSHPAARTSHSST
jgi:hypothetical protein